MCESFVGAVWAVCAGCVWAHPAHKVQGHVWGLCGEWGEVWYGQRADLKRPAHVGCVEEVWGLCWEWFWG